MCNVIGNDYCRYPALIISHLIICTSVGVKHGDSDSDLSEGDISHISLPPSLFQHMLKTSDDKTGLVFTSYSDAVLFPIAGHDNNSDIAMTIGSNVIGATVVTDLPVQNIPEPVQVEFKVGNLSVMDNDILLRIDIIVIIDNNINFVNSEIKFNRLVSS